MDPDKEVGKRSGSLGRSTYALLPFFVCALTALASVAAFNVMVNPYANLRDSTVYSARPAALERDRLFKSALIRGTDFDCISAGSSRVGEGFPTKHIYFRRCSHVLDVSLAGSSIQETGKAVRLAARTRPLKQLLLSADFFAFNAYRAERPDTADGAFRESWADKARLWFSTAFSISTLGDSVRTVFARGSGPQTILPDGSISDEFISHFNAGRSARAAFQRSIVGYIAHELPAPDSKAALVHGTRDTIQEFGALIDIAHTHSIDTVIVVPPVHSWYEQMLSILGLSNQVEEWKRKLVAENDAVAKRHRRKAFSIVDFSGYNVVTTEPVPDADSRHVMRYYWDHSHFRRTLGQRILHELNKSNAEEAFGVSLSGANIDAVLVDQRQAATRWADANKQNVEEIRGIISCYAAPDLSVRLKLTQLPKSRCREIEKYVR